MNVSSELFGSAAAVSMERRATDRVGLAFLENEKFGSLIVMVIVLLPLSILGAAIPGAEISIAEKEMNLNLHRVSYVRDHLSDKRSKSGYRHSSVLFSRYTPGIHPGTAQGSGSGLHLQASRVWASGAGLNFSNEAFMVEAEMSVARGAVIHQRMLNSGRRSDVPTDSVSRASSRRSDIAYEAELSVGNHFYGGYLLDFVMGSQQLPMKLLVDTSTNLLWVQLASCTICQPQPDPPFDSNQSGTYRRMRCVDSLCSSVPGSSCTSDNYCKFTYDYGGGNLISGEVANDMAVMYAISSDAPSYTPVDIVLGGALMNNVYGFFGFDGVIGLGRGKTSLVSQLQLTVGNKFSYCLLSLYDTTAKKNSFIFGDRSVIPGLDYHYTPYAPQSRDTGLYYVQFNGVSVNGNRLSISPKALADGSGGTVMDSGQTISTFTPGVFGPIAEYLKQHMQYPPITVTLPWNLLCYNIAGVPNPQFPKITLHFQNIDYNLSDANSYFVDSVAQTACLAMAETPGPINVIGYFQQQNTLMLFDNDREELGMAICDCATLV